MAFSKRFCIEDESELLATKISCEVVRQFMAHGSGHTAGEIQAALEPVHLYRCAFAVDRAVFAALIEILGNACEQFADMPEEGDASA